MKLDCYIFKQHLHQSIAKVLSLAIFKLVQQKKLNPICHQHQINCVYFIFFVTSKSMLYFFYYKLYISIPLLLLEALSFLLIGKICLNSLLFPLVLQNHIHSSLALSCVIDHSKQPSLKPKCRSNASIEVSIHLASKFAKTKQYRPKNHKYLALSLSKTPIEFRSLFSKCANPNLQPSTIHLWNPSF